MWSIIAEIRESVFQLLAAAAISDTNPHHPPPQAGKSPRAHPLLGKDLKTTTSSLQPISRPHIPPINPQAPMPPIVDRRAAVSATATPAREPILTAPLISGAAMHADHTDDLRYWRRMQPDLSALYFQFSLGSAVPQLETRQQVV